MQIRCCSCEFCVAVYNVVEDSPAFDAGLKKGDIIIKLGNNAIDNLADFRYELYKYSPLSKVSVTYIRNGEEFVAEIILGKSKTIML